MIRDGLRRVVGALSPEPGTTEGSIMVGLVLVAIAFFLAGASAPAEIAWVFPPLGVGLPGVLIVAIGLGFNLHWIGRRNG